MDFKNSENRIWLENEQGEEIAYVSFPEVAKGVVEIQSTVVDRSLQGKGIAGKLLEELEKELREKNHTAIPTCSYAVKWFEKHPEHADLLAKEEM